MSLPCSPNKKYPDPEDCDRFYQCNRDGSKFNSKQCPQGKQFHAQRLKCRPYGRAECSLPCASDDLMTSLGEKPKQSRTKDTMPNITKSDSNPLSTFLPLDTGTGGSDDKTPLKENLISEDTKKDPTADSDDTGEPNKAPSPDSGRSGNADGKQVLTTKSNVPLVEITTAASTDKEGDSVTIADKVVDDTKDNILIDDKDNLDDKNKVDIVTKEPKDEVTTQKHITTKSTTFLVPITTTPTPPPKPKETTKALEVDVPHLTKEPPYHVISSEQPSTAPGNGSLIEGEYLLT